MAAGWTQDGEGREAARTAGPVRVR
jgi:hypothetical protein